VLAGRSCDPLAEPTLWNGRRLMRNSFVLTNFGAKNTPNAPQVVPVWSVSNTSTTTHRTSAQVVLVYSVLKIQVHWMYTDFLSVKCADLQLYLKNNVCGLRNTTLLEQLAINTCMEENQQRILQKKMFLLILSWHGCSYVQVSFFSAISVY
jgi:hypothetical protein